MIIFCIVKCAFSEKTQRSEVTLECFQICSVVFAFLTLLFWFISFFIRQKFREHTDKPPLSRFVDQLAKIVVEETDI